MKLSACVLFHLLGSERLAVLGERENFKFWFLAERLLFLLSLSLILTLIQSLTLINLIQILTLIYLIQSLILIQFVHIIISHHTRSP